VHWSLFCFVAAIALVVQMFAFKKLILLGTSALMATWIFLLLGGVVTLFFWLIVEEGKGAQLSFSQAQIWWLVAAGVSLAFINLGHFWAFEGGGLLALVSLTVSVTATLMAATLGVLVLGEVLTITSAAGIVLAFAGVALMVKG
jgi:drug/metabolite transporter (DMT)-like permease